MRSCEWAVTMAYWHVSGAYGLERAGLLADMPAGEGSTGTPARRGKASWGCMGHDPDAQGGGGRAHVSGRLDSIRGQGQAVLMDWAGRSGGRQASGGELRK